MTDEQTPYYEGDNLRKSFAITEYDKVKRKQVPITPTSVSFAVVDEVDNLYFEGMATMRDDLVYGEVPKHATAKAGLYTIIYTIRLPNGDTRTHKQYYRILPKGAVVSKAFDEAFKVAPDSDGSAILTAKGNAIRALRQLGKSAKEAADAVEILEEKKTGRRKL